MTTWMTPFSWSFTTEDATAPVIANWSPTGTNIPVGQDIVFEVTDAGSGVDLTTLDVTINGTSAVVNGAPELGYSLSTSPIAGGWEVTVGHPDLPALTTVPVLVSVDDVFGNPGSQGWSYETADTIAPQVSNNSPTGLDVDEGSNIFFKITDVGAGVDPDSIVVYIGGELAYDGVSGFALGYQGLDSDVSAVSGGYEVTIDKEAEYDGLTTYEVTVDAQDLQSPPNIMDQFAWEFTTRETSGPVVFNQDPVPLAYDVDVATDISFDISDATAVDQNTLQTTLNNIPVIVDGAPAPGYSVTITGPVTLLHVVIDPVQDLQLDNQITLEVDVADTTGAPTNEVWSFNTVRGSLGPITLFAVAGNGLVSLRWAVPPPETMLQEVFELRRSTVSVPTAPDQGQLIYSGLDKEFVDTDVVNGTVYHYTIFVVRRHVNGVAEYAPYENRASDTARPRGAPETQSRDVEYVPVRGDFGARTVNPLPGGRTTSAWGATTETGRRYSNLIQTTFGRPVSAPVRGIIKSVVDVESQIANQVLKRIEIRTTTNLVLMLSGIILLSPVVTGTQVEAGQLIGKTVAGVVEFEIYKYPDHRTVRPRYFYLTVEERDGRS